MWRFVAFFVTGVVLAIAFWGSLAPKLEHTPVGLDSMPGYVRSFVCRNDGYPVSVIRRYEESSYSIYDVTCSDGTVVPFSW